MRLFLSLLLALAFSARLMAADKPNIIVMMTDDQRHDYMSCAGHPFIKTPNMDRIAKDGYRFTNMFVTNSLCAPSRATLMTGQYSHTNGVLDNLVIWGTPDKVADEIEQFRHTIGDFGTLLYAGKDWTDPALARRSMVLLKEKVLPKLG